MNHSEFCGSLDVIRHYGFVRFALRGKQYCGVIDGAWLCGAMCIISRPALYVKSETEDTWEVYSEHDSVYFTFNWLQAEYFWVSDTEQGDSKLCFVTDEGPRYILLQGEEAA
jgi:hypothetical protein